MPWVCAEPDFLSLLTLNVEFHICQSRGGSGELGGVSPIWSAYGMLFGKLELKPYNNSSWAWLRLFKNPKRDYILQQASISGNQLRSLFISLTERFWNWMTSATHHDNILCSLYLADSTKVGLGVGNSAMESYCLVVTPANHCSEFQMRNCQFPMPKVAFIKSAIYKFLSTLSFGCKY